MAESIAWYCALDPFNSLADLTIISLFYQKQSLIIISSAFLSPSGLAVRPRVGVRRKRCDPLRVPNSEWGKPPLAALCHRDDESRKRCDPGRVSRPRERALLSGNAHSCEGMLTQTGVSPSRGTGVFCRSQFIPTPN